MGGGGQVPVETESVFFNDWSATLAVSDAPEIQELLRCGQYGLIR